MNITPKLGTLLIFVGLGCCMSPLQAQRGGYANAVAEPLALRGMYQIGDQPFFCIFDRPTNKGTWVGLNETVDDYTVTRYDPTKQSIVVRFRGASYTLRLDAPGTPTGGAPQASAIPAATTPQAELRATGSGPLSPPPPPPPNVEPPPLPFPRGTVPPTPPPADFASQEMLRSFNEMMSATGSGARFSDLAAQSGFQPVQDSPITPGTDSGVAQPGQQGPRNADGEMELPDWIKNIQVGDAPIDRTPVSRDP